MKKRNIIAALLSVFVLTTATACGKSEETKKDKSDKKVVKVGVVGESNEMWDPVIEELAKEGVEIQLVTFTDYSTPNRALNDGETDLNAFQHYVFLNEEIKNNGYKIKSIGDTFISAMNIYSNKVSNVSEIGQGAKIAVPNDATNEGRALKVLEAAGLIKLDPNAGDSPDKTDIVENKLNIELVEVDAANVYSLLPDVAAAVINCNYALDNGLNPGKDAIFQDDVKIYTGKNYVNLIAARTEDADNEIYKKIVEAYQSDAVKEIFADTFKGAYIAAWE
ncbi:MAG: MetQ/NlpA family ABC transporter substrate-binding protein [Clostridiales bacterium]|uniref:MetQ/NlpA family ABC transporter substrate-binding protein n=1 Tax=Clostridium sp. N3C TaxID=1776758 RepID=UPI00092E0D83|nr:MetQ/NlpA family ABC transporter substrate-binding protein [Clostridium sp. N3C]NLZ48653.1 MetQ/NlpA family ABC transporter substrate-binding protein [Clostridiales bacterium]SCN21838.1 D-methionine-binding lipoprotein MetQ precursor [Clostridium sp. N3C]